MPRGKWAAAAAAAAIAMSLAAAGAFAVKESPPDVAIMQASYDEEVGSGSKLHDRNLQIIEVSCTKYARKYRCFVTFFSKADPYQHLYSDLAEMAPTALGGWQLTSGLCKRRDGPNRADAPPTSHIFRAKGHALNGWVEVCASEFLRKEDVIRFDH